ncbi:type 1 glutamine amidotransferase domain-containing protein [Williamsia sp. D3]|uniref:type 1 glutamine amidotransferase domain-containing protein n=1 Tax=Williamsia sp. D3 TaxID=1313067 RepID=UPI0003D327E4|nr:type 1 glutamine amidotransferase domain-containing protein [Williamsia sp. D3]ETD30079.1 glutamine amidotransferase [Williamsia sp. D3]
MANELSGQKIAFLVAPEGVEQVELTEPWEAVKKAGGTPSLVSLESGQIQAFNHLDKADQFAVDKVVAEVPSADFDALVLPGGVANPDNLRMNDEAVKFISGFFTEGKPVAAICHAPWTLIEAGVLSDRTLTSWPSLRTDITNAGGQWTDEEVVVDNAGSNTLITSRKPDDLPAFCEALIREFAADNR